MDKALVIMPISIGGRIIAENIVEGLKQNNFDIVIFDELKENEKYLDLNYKLIVGYDFSPIKFKIDRNLNFPCLAYFADVIYSKTSGPYYKEYFKYLNRKDIFTFYWDRKLAKKENRNYQALFVDTNIYKDKLKPSVDIVFIGRLDTDIRLRTYLELNKKLKNKSFNWYGIKKHYFDALNRCLNQEEKNILEKTYKGFIDNSFDMAQAINSSKITYNINSQGESSLNFRTFETLACKRLLISDFREELDLFDNVIPIYYNIDDLIEKIEYYLDNPEEYKKITQYCYNIILEKYNSRVCVENMLKKCL